MKGTEAVGSIGSATLAITMIAAILLLIFGFRLARRPADRQRGLLMVACGIVFIANVLIWTL
ncbi:MAG TPA: hypothetical protein VNA29_01370 [Sphingomicrobium sp.]|nr:hypothetical protein [Sphingomicrobium sp.]